MRKRPPLQDYVIGSWPLVIVWSSLTALAVVQWFMGNADLMAVVLIITIEIPIVRARDRVSEYQELKRRWNQYDDLGGLDE